MKQIDVRFSAIEMTEIKNMVGKNFIKLKCDPFEFSTAVYGIVGIALEDKDYAFINTIETMDYYGVQEDVALFKMKHMMYTDIQSMVQEQSMIEIPVERIISEIIVVNERQRLFEKGVQTYEVLLTRGIIFKFKEGHEISFEKNIWFSEDITVEKGYNLIDRFSPAAEFCESWEGDYRGECLRELITFIM